MMQEPNIPDELRPLRLVAGYSIRRDGVVFRADGTSVTSVPLFRARRYARKDIEHDPLRESRSGVMHGRGDGESLVFDADGQRLVQWVRLPSKAERVSKLRGDGLSTFCGGSMEASGDTDACWYWLDDRDGVHLLFHGPSWAQHIWLRNY